MDFWRHYALLSTDTINRLAACKNPLEAFEVQVQYMGDVMRDGLHEGMKLLELTQDTALRAGPADGTTGAKS